MTRTPDMTDVGLQPGKFYNRIPTDAQWPSVLRLIEDLPAVAAYVATWRGHPTYAVIAAADALEVAAWIDGVQRDQTNAIQFWEMPQDWFPRMSTWTVRVFAHKNADPEEVGRFVMARARAEAAIDTECGRIEAAAEDDLSGGIA